MILALVLIPTVAGLVAFAVPWSRIPPRALLVGTAVAHLGLVIATFVLQPGPALGGWMKADSLGLLFLLITSGLFMVAAIYAVGYLDREVNVPRPDWVEGTLFSNAPERQFVGYMVLFLAAMTLVTLSQHLGLLWVAVEATTLASAPLIYFHRHHRSLEATWKYLLIASVGIALALLGTLFLAVSATDATGHTLSLVVKDLIVGGSSLQGIWLKAGFLLILVGYGTKMGLVPFHTWLPDAHSESPSLVSALMSGALLNCAFLGILRTYQVLQAAGLAPFAQGLLVGFGLVSMGVAAAFIIRQSDYKRMLAYSSIEHMGILALGVGVGGAASFGAMFHAVNHSLAKGLLFLVAGNILAVYRTTSTRTVRGALRALPISGALWVAGFLAIVGAPPFGSFLSEFTILQNIMVQGHTGIAVLYLVLLAIVFMGMATIMLRMAQGEPWAREGPGPAAREAILAVAPPALLALVALLLGIYLPSWLDHILHGAAALIGGGL